MDDPDKKATQGTKEEEREKQTNEKKNKNKNEKHTHNIIAQVMANGETTMENYLPFNIIP